MQYSILIDCNPSYQNPELDSHSQFHPSPPLDPRKRGFGMHLSPFLLLNGIYTDNEFA